MDKSYRTMRPLKELGDRPVGSQYWHSVWTLWYSLLYVIDSSIAYEDLRQAFGVYPLVNVLHASSGKYTVRYVCLNVLSIFAGYNFAHVSTEFSYLTLRRWFTADTSNVDWMYNNGLVEWRSKARRIGSLINRWIPKVWHLLSRYSGGTLPRQCIR